MATSRRPVVINLMSEDDEPEPIIPSLHIPKTASRVPTSPEGVIFLNDLSNYLPLGSLVLGEVTDFESAWEEVVDKTAIPSGLSEQNALDIEKLLTRRRLRLFVSLPSKSVLRVYLLPNDVGHRFEFLSRDRGADAHLFSLCQNIDVSIDSWNGQPKVRESFDLYAVGEEGSLYFLFNNIPSPNPTSERVTSHFHEESMTDLLDTQYQLHGLKTALYPYQRRSAALMLQRECEDRLQLDPRLEKRVAPDGLIYYYDPWDVEFLRSPRFYESCKGGILAETMVRMRGYRYHELKASGGVPLST
jgi:hypothetical protein